MNVLVKFGRLVKFEHTIFALPYAYLGMILASFQAYGTLPSWRVFFWVTLAMVGARSSAMALNRLIDRAIDAKNPRTSNREIPRGIVSVTEAVIFSTVSLVVLMISAWALNDLCFKLLPIAVVFLVGYSYAKRYTWTCHIVLGVTDALAALGGWIAVTGDFHPAAWILGGIVAVWIAGFDIIYACQDVEFDRAHRLHSIPARFGVKNALLIAKALHILTIILFLSLPQVIDLGWIYYVGVVLIAILLIMEHRLVKPDDMSNIHTAFFTINSYIASVAFIFTFANVLVNIL
ncbi:UbiA-like polyprenyltransferase [Paenibacillus xerothermodurans]|uniref:4-hydroxybenzoate polyprenyltransferase n=1 Tax=Paenibacillus xerothermodurans TaxID=1977292 RepID=A0A2W1P2H9_PAEXE|nr:UbiA-like polyprenyltransferase [Paenibacillus xerothermodurans]PZE21338.1 4-hydroxybenzoate octaprenyltransferase [Paenibacillus xerothermodurans]